MDSASPSAALQNPDMALVCKLFESSNSRNAIDRDRDFAGSGSLSAALSPAPGGGRRHPDWTWGGRSTPIPVCPAQLGPKNLGSKNYPKGNIEAVFTYRQYGKTGPDYIISLCGPGERFPRRADRDRLPRSAGEIRDAATGVHRRARQRGGLAT